MTEEKENKFNPTVITIVVVGVILLVILLLFFSDRSEETETGIESVTTEQGSVETVSDDSGAQSSGETDSQDDGAVADTTDGDSESQDQGETEVGTVQSNDTEDSVAEGLPSNWNELNDKEKIAVNPFDCDLEAQTIYADDGSCHSKNPDPLPETDSQAPLRLVSGLSLDSGFNYTWSPPELDCSNTIEVDVDHLCSITLLFEGIADSDEFQNSPSGYLQGIEYDEGLACLRLNYGFLTLHVESELIPSLYDAYQTIPSYVYPHSDESPYSTADCATEIQKGQFYVVSFSSPDHLELPPLGSTIRDLRVELQTTPLNTIEHLVVPFSSPPASPSLF